MLAFARLREVLGAPAADIDLRQDATAGEAWDALEDRFPVLRELRESTRIARNGRIVTPAEPLREGDEVALLPPVGGG